MRFRTTSGVIVGILLVLAAAAASLGADDGSLSRELTDGLRASLKMDPATRAIRNALTGNDPKTITLNREIVQRHRAVFSHKIKTKDITNQQASGRCWLFAGLNVLRPAIIFWSDASSVCSFFKNVSSSPFRTVDVVRP